MFHMTVFHMTERIISLIRANFANWPELSRVPVERPPPPTRRRVWRTKDRLTASSG